MKKKDLSYLKENNIIQWYNTIQSRKYNRMYRLYNNITYWYHYSKNAYFITFTISNKYINKLYDFERILKKVLNNLKFEKWIFNPDLSPTKERLHYHVLLFTNEEYLKDSITWLYGYVQIKPILVFNKKALGKYITKLSYHALKGTTPKILFSRNSKKSLQV